MSSKTTNKIVFRQWEGLICCLSSSRAASCKCQNQTFYNIFCKTDFIQHHLDNRALHAGFYLRKILLYFKLCTTWVLCKNSKYSTCRPSLQFPNPRLLLFQSSLSFSPLHLLLCLESGISFLSIWDRNLEWRTSSEEEVYSHPLK